MSFGVGIQTLTFTDPTRPTKDYNTGAIIADERVIQTEIRYPTLATAAAAGPEIADAAPASQFGPFPVIVFAHGYAVMPDTYQQLLDSWVEAGFVVVAPVFPVSGYYHWQAQGGGGAPENDMGNQPADVAFLVNQLAAGKAGALGTIMKLRDLALAGQSDGGTTVAGLEFFSYFRGTFDSMSVKPKAIGMFSSGPFTADGRYVDPPSPAAVLDVQSDSDTCNVTGNAEFLYNQVAPATPSHYFLTLLGADHVGPYEDELPWAPVVRQISTMFFELELGSSLHPVTTAQLAAAGGVSSTSHGSISQMSVAAAISLPVTELNTNGCGVSQPGPAGLTGTP
jgi:hypothetical protein